MQFDPTPFEFWPAFKQFAEVLGSALLIVLVVGLMTSLVVYGARGAKMMLGQIGDGLREFASTSPRRVLALTGLTLRESIRRKALYVFAVFAVLFMFGGWFLTNSNADPRQQVEVHVTFVLKAITWLSIPVALLLSCWGLPEDIRQRSLHTVVTKPARRHEIVLGRILGFTLVTTFLLAAMSVLGYVWTIRNVPERAQSKLVARVPIYGDISFKDREGNYTTSGINVGDIWEFRSYIHGGTRARAIWIMHGITPERLGDAVSLESSFEAFRSYKGDMSRGLLAQYSFVDDGRERFARAVAAHSEFETFGRAINEGDYAQAADELDILADKIRAGEPKFGERDFGVVNSGLQQVPEAFERWTSRPEDRPWAEKIVAAVENCRAAAAAGDDAKFADALAAFATTIREQQAELKKHVRQLVVPLPEFFEIKEYRENVTRVPRKLSFTPDDSLEPQTIDLFDDLAPGGRLRVEVACLDSGQYLGMARPDLFVRTPDRSFASSYFKAVGGIWMMAFLVVVIGVTASTFLKGPVATLLTFTLLIVGQGFREFMDTYLEKFAANQIDKEGGGPLISIYRLVMHMNQSQKIENETLGNVLKFFDDIALNLLWLVQHIVPDFTKYGMTAWVSKGFDVDFNAAILPCIAQTLAFLIPCLVIGYYALKLRELEAK